MDELEVRDQEENAVKGVVSGDLTRLIAFHSHALYQDAAGYNYTFDSLLVVTIEANQP